MEETSIRKALPEAPSYNRLNLPSDKRDEYIAELKKAGMPISEKNIRYLYEHHSEGE